MTILMISTGPGHPEWPGTRVGGLPLVPEGFGWPQCAKCEGTQQFLGHVALSDVPELGLDGRLLALFQCADGGGCGEWDPNAGANAALLFDTRRLAPAMPPYGEVDAQLGATWSVELVSRPEPYGELRPSRAEGQPSTERQVLGQLGGPPHWLGSPATPDCGGCETEMRFVAQWEETRDRQHSPNFGGGSAYAFVCPPCERGALLWQC
ncbi:hypothetical protein [Streptomyces sp. NPDC005438]|uniref:hypothetical protein n=1 Tax=Streptomyces sp. NPDC005438 TaxID=3156880 RepID=UPI0033A044CB